MTPGASKEGYCGHMNHLSFRGRWPAKKGRNTHINILEMETVWMACQRFEESMKEKTISLQVDDTTAVANLFKEGETHCKTLNSLLRKILLKCHKNQVTVYPEYLRGVACLHKYPIQGQESSGVELRRPSQPQVVQTLWYSSSGSVCK